MADVGSQGRPLLEALERSGKSQQAGAGSAEVELFCVKVGDERFGVESGLVKEVVRIGPITPLPGSPPFLNGVTAHRGDVIAVIDLGRFLGRGETHLHARSRMAVAHSEEMVVGLLADEVLGISSFKASNISPAPLGADAGTEFISGVVAQGEPLNVLDLRRAIASARARAVTRR